MCFILFYLPRSPWIGYYCCHALIGTLTLQRFSPKINMMDFLYVFVSWNITVILHLITSPDDIQRKQHAFANNLDFFRACAFMAFCFLRCFLSLKSLAERDHKTTVHVALRYSFAAGLNAFKVNLWKQMAHSSSYIWKVKLFNSKTHLLSSFRTERRFCCCRLTYWVTDVN